MTREESIQLQREIADPSLGVEAAIDMLMNRAKLGKAEACFRVKMARGLIRVPKYLKEQVKEPPVQYVSIHWDNIMALLGCSHEQKDDWGMRESSSVELTPHNEHADVEVLGLALAA